MNRAADSLPVSRWAASQCDGQMSGYARNFAELVAAGSDVDGEARLADALVGRHARILDVGSGMGRVAAALAARGHQVVAIEPDPALRAQSHTTYPQVAVRDLDALQITAEAVGEVDLAVVVGNVLIFLAADTERDVLSRLRDVLAPGGRILAGFQHDGAKSGSRSYPAAEFVADVEAVGLRVEHRFGSYELAAPTEDYSVWVLTRA